MSTQESRLWVLVLPLVGTLVGTSLGGAISIYTSYLTTKSQAEAASKRESRGTRLAALLAYNDACSATVEDDRIDGTIVHDRIRLLEAKTPLKKEADSIEVHYDKQHDEGEIHWSTMIAKRAFANLLFDGPLQPLELSQEDVEFGWDDPGELRKEADRLKQHGEKLAKRCADETSTLAHKLD
jgi:hypothetical protein